MGFHGQVSQVLGCVQRDTVGRRLEQVAPKLRT